MNWIKRLTSRKRNRRRGMLTVEWILLLTVLVIGIIGGLGAVRIAINAELQDLADAIEKLNCDTVEEDP